MAKTEKQLKETAKNPLVSALADRIEEHLHTRRRDLVAHLGDVAVKIYDELSAQMDEEVNELREMRELVNEKRKKIKDLDVKLEDLRNGDFTNFPELQELLEREGGEYNDYTNLED
jgi:predicted  nucleic acid-binding Zn-ribbon protein